MNSIARAAGFVLTLIATSCGDNSNEQMNLVIACANGELKRVEMLLPEVGDPNFRSLKGDTPLTAASANGHVELVLLLLSHGADWSFPDSSGMFAEDIAAKNGHHDVLAVILDSKAAEGR